MKFLVQTYLSLLFILVALAYGMMASADTCSRYCNPELSKPCGGACIALTKSCHKDWTTACVGEKPKSKLLSFDSPKHVDAKPKN